MANLNRKERRAQRNESNTIGILLRLFFGLSFIGLAVVLFGELDLNYVFSIFTADIIVSLIYVILNKSRITTSLAVNTNVRVYHCIPHHASNNVLLRFRFMARRSI